MFLTWTCKFNIINMLMIIHRLTLIKYTLLLFLTLFFYACLSGCSRNNIKSNLKSSIISINKNWSVIDKHSSVYLSSFPIISSTSSKNRGVHYLMLVYNKNLNSYVISIVGGKIYENLYEVVIIINNNNYYLATSEERSWLTNTDQVINLIKDMIVSDRLIVLNKFYDQSKATDIYSLEGFKESFEVLNKITN